MTPAERELLLALAEAVSEIVPALRTAIRRLAKEVDRDANMRHIADAFRDEDL